MLRLNFSRTGLSCLALAIALPAFAQDSRDTVPDFLGETASPAGALGNVRIFYDSSTEEYWLLPEGGQVVLRGDIYTPAGENITDLLPRPETSSSEPRNENEQAQTDDAPALIRSPEDASRPPSIAGNVGQDDRLATTNTPELIGNLPGVSETDLDQPANEEGQGPPSFSLYSQPFDERSPEEQQVIRETLVSSLFGRLESSETPEEYAEFLQRFSSIVEGVLQGTPPDQLEASGGSGISPAVRQFVGDAGMELPIAPISQSEANPAPDTMDIPESAQAQQRMEPEELLEEAREAFWFGVGSQDGPVVYAFIDPTCPFCARAMKQIQTEVEGGDLGLRVILTPLLSPRSGPMTAGILASEDPVDAFWRHELSFADYGNSNVRPVDPSSIDIQYRQALQQNSELFIRSGMSGVPAFVMQTPTDGAVAMEGIPDPKTLLQALPER